MDRLKLSSIDEELESSEVAALCFLCRDVVNKKRLEGIRDAKKLFLRLQEIGLLDNHFFLCQLLQTIGRPDLLNFLETDSRRPEETDANPMLSEYRVMLYKVYADMTNENFEKMKFLLSDKLGRRQTETCKTALDVFAEMEKNADLLSNTNLRVLHATLLELDQQLALTIQRYMDGVTQLPPQNRSAHVSVDYQRVNNSRQPTQSINMLMSVTQPGDGAASVCPDAAPHIESPTLPDHVECRLRGADVLPDMATVQECKSSAERFSMAAKDKIRCNKTAIQMILSGDHRLILNKVLEKGLITRREYKKLKSINKEDEEGHVIELVDKIMDKGEDRCQGFLNLLQTDDDIQETFPDLKNILLNDACLLPRPVQVSSVHESDVLPPGSKRQKEDMQYELNSQPTGLCVIINNMNFKDGTARNGTDKDAQSLTDVFSWLGFRVLMCEDQTKDQMDRTLKCFASQSDLSQLQEFNVKEWFGSGFAALQEAPKHGDAFICCILSHGVKGAVLGIDRQPLYIKQITRTFKATVQSPLTNKPKVFLIQACQGGQTQHGVLLEELQADGSHSLSIPEFADVLVAVATVEDHEAIRHIRDGSWFVQSVCRQLKEGCQRGEDIITILHSVNNEVSQKEGSSQNPGARKQMPEVRFTLTNRLVLSPHQH
ncbi:caspase-8-like isoform X1 [Sebastes umbrosus]|uniref:caspase-8-like isoform X1 n=1 Tax=Sebastes umbrosus TaxID=72105 RepID=UPI0018A01A89|nr:caspase-8-like isoform X1 [Sebastes umbrosus]XP_037642657.1 caspase-8-like isoform X1 [Sebastes umbrosus]XP_037642658.1 caspase-8-like isoform X1 [Sebastes umbrosus]